MDAAAPGGPACEDPRRAISARDPHEERRLRLTAHRTTTFTGSPDFVLTGHQTTRIAFNVVGTAPWQYVLGEPGATVLAAEDGVNPEEFGYRRDRVLTTAHSRLPRPDHRRQ
ncbi:hypothetical protein DP939_43995 [Spongiactinospora rosea]|uniref:Uncharacterized protein n=1 Tax=Spongiactinospora rosea TaxID=2248750 RepID=A0A366LKW1_9ACTN|nr:hypothetical protein DP939_43995 [Spongiactinospora rosea]